MGGIGDAVGGIDFASGINNIPTWLWYAIIFAILWLAKPWKKHD